MKQALVGVVCLAAGSLGTYYVMKGHGLHVTPPPTQAAAPASAGANGEAVITLTPEAAARAGIEVTQAIASTSGARLRIPAVVQPNAYRAVIVTPVVSGRITRVPVELGQNVRRGQTLAEIYSPELADAQTQYI